MLTTVLLSLDSLFAGAALGFFGLRKKHWPFAWKAMGTADLLALIVGRGLSDPIGSTMTPSQQITLFVCCAALAILLGRTCSHHPRLTILAVATLFSVDNLLAGSHPAILHMNALAVVATGGLSGLACSAGLRLSESIEHHLRPKVPFALASIAIIAGVFVF
jgi:hypothetical protein